MHGIVVGISKTDNGAAALDWALRQAVLRRVPLAAVRVYDIPSHGGYYSVGEALRSTTPEYELAELALAQEALKAAVSRVPGSDTVESKALVLRGRPPQVLVDAAEQAELLVVGTKGVGALTRLVHLGSVSSSVLHHATGPVAVVPEPSQPRHDTTARIVAGVDGSAPSTRALRWAVEQARASGAVLVPFAVRAADRRGTPADTEALVASLRTAAEQAGAAESPGVVVEPEVRFGHAGEELISAADTADLLVLGSRGRGGFSRLLVGSTSTQCAGHASCPVVVVRPES